MLRVNCRGPGPAARSKRRRMWSVGSGGCPVERRRRMGSSRLFARSRSPPWRTMPPSQRPLPGPSGVWGRTRGDVLLLRVGARRAGEEQRQLARDRSSGADEREGAERRAPPRDFAARAVIHRRVRDGSAPGARGLAGVGPHAAARPAVAPGAIRTPLEPSTTDRPACGLPVAPGSHPGACLFRQPCRALRHAPLRLATNCLDRSPRQSVHASVRRRTQ